MKMVSLHSLRQALGLSTTQAAKRYGTSQSTYVRLEQSEAENTATLASLQRAAEAMGCRLKYFYEPVDDTLLFKGYTPEQRLARSFQLSDYFRQCSKKS